MGKRLINVDEVEEIIPVLVDKLLENNLITEEQADQIICAIFKGTVTPWHIGYNKNGDLKFLDAKVYKVK